MNLPRLTNAEYEHVEQLAKQSGIPLDQCPTCGAKPVEVVDGVTGWENGTYRFRGKTHPCDCETQKVLRKHYSLANIGDQYQRLDWNDYDNEDVKRIVATYLDKWESFKLNGMGLEFASPKLGVGKTFGSTYVGKELIKKGEKVFFIPFLEVISVLTREHPQAEAYERRLYDSTVLILDEVVPPWTARMADLFRGKLEEVIRNRTNFNRPTIMSTNMTPEELHSEYPRVYSLLEAKQMRILLDGTDARRGRIAEENLELALNGEVRPIT